MAEETARRDRIRNGLEPSPADSSGQWGSGTSVTGIDSHRPL